MYNGHDHALVRGETVAPHPGTTTLPLGLKLGSKNQLMFEMLPGYHTQNFVSEIYRVRESADPGALDAQFDWATSYQSSASGRQFTKGRVDIYLISVYMLSPV